MKHRIFTRIVALHLAIAMSLSATTAYAREQGGSLAVEGTTFSVVDGERIPASPQGADVLVTGVAFGSHESVGLWLTFANGSVYGVDAGTILTDGEGAFAARVALDASLPVGRHTFSARGKTSGLGGTADFVLLPGTGPSPTTGTRLITQPGAVRQLETTTLRGDGFAAVEAVALWLTQPNGAVIGLGRIMADADGAFVEPLTMPGWLPVGTYSVTARGLVSGATAIGELRLDYGNGLDVDGARLAASLGRAVQRTVLQIVASGFTPNETISFWQTLPDGAVMPRGDLRADGAGNLRAEIVLDETLPTGTHYLSFRSNQSKQSGFARIVLVAGPVEPGDE